MLSEKLVDTQKVLDYNKPFDPKVLQLYNHWLSSSVAFLIKSLEKLVKQYDFLNFKLSKIRTTDHKILKYIVREPAAQAWLNALNHYFLYGFLKDIDEKEIPLDLNFIDYIIEQINDQSLVTSFSCNIDLNLNKYWLRVFFGTSILFENDKITEDAKEIISQSFKIIEQYNPALLNEIYLLCPSIQFIQDPSAHPDKIVSFSDNLIPGCIYVSVRTSQGFLCPYDLADSIIHEHRHQKLYLFEYFHPVTDKNNLKVPSLWREELRPVSGLFHAVYVFQNLLDYWLYISQYTANAEIKNKASRNVQLSQERLTQAHQTLKNCKLTDYGNALLTEFQETLYRTLSIEGENIVL